MEGDFGGNPGKDSEQTTPPEGYRRSSRINFGNPPDRYGDWTKGLGRSFFTSTKLTATGTPMKRITFVAPPNVENLRKAEDNVSVSSHASSMVDLLDEQIQKAEREMAEKKTFLDSLKSMRDDQVSRLKKEQNLSDTEEYDHEEDVKPVAKNRGVEDPAAAFTGKFFPTPHGIDQETPPKFAMTQDSTPHAGKLYNPDMSVADLIKKYEVQPLRQTSLFSQKVKKLPNPMTAPYGDAGRASFGGQGGKLGDGGQTGGTDGSKRSAHSGGVPSGAGGGGHYGGGGFFGGGPYGGGPYGGGYPIQPFNPLSGMDKLADALVKAMQIQSKNTEKFVARQSHGSALPTFSGNPLDWPIFAHHYLQSTADCGFSPAQNMARLEKALRGEARKTVRSLMIIPNNANEVISVLEQRFGRAEYVIQALVEIARKAPTPKESKLATLVDFAIAVRNLVTTIKTLNQPSYLTNPQLLQELVDKLPDHFKFQWGMRVLDLGGGQATLEDFGQWINRAAEAASRVVIPKLSFKDANDDKKDERTFAATEDPDSRLALRSEEVSACSESETPAPKPCGCCEKEGHSIGNCEAFKKMTVDERWTLVKKKNRCFRCLRGGHGIGTCRSKSTCGAEGCSRRHHTLLHGTGPSSGAKQSGEEKKEEKVNEINASVDSFTGSSLLRIVVVTLYGPKGRVTANALLDEGSTVTLLSSQVAADLGLEGRADPLRIKWTNGVTQEDTSSQKVDCWIGPYGENEKYKLIKVRTVKSLNLPPQRTDLKEIVKVYPHLQTTRMKYLPGERPVILLGQPHIHLSLARDVVEKDDQSPVITKTKLGWVMHGPSNGKSEVESTFSCHHESDDDLLHSLVKESFALESIGIKTMSTRSREDVAAEELMEKVTHRIGNRWQTGLLWRKENTVLPPSKEVALRRLHHVERKLEKNETLKAEYSKKIQHYLDSGYARKLPAKELNQPSDVEWYLPHFETRHPNKPGKIRIVFDGASRVNVVSLNDYLLTGPDLLVSLPGVLVKFRQRRIAISGDIGEMFHQVHIRPEDCPAQRFLWREDGNKEPSTYQLEVMMFGSVCSPFCAQYVKNHNAQEFKNEYPEAVATIIQKHYMDDYLDSMDTEVEAVKLAEEVRAVHRQGGFEIGKWISNSNKLLESITGEAVTLTTKNLAEWSEIQTERALGLYWIPDDDMFTFE